MEHNQHGFVRVAAVVPQMILGNVEANVLKSANEAFVAYKQGARVVVFPELGLTGYTLRDLFKQTHLQKAAVAGLVQFAEATRNIAAVLVVGLPLVVDDQLFNVAAISYKGKILGFVPKSYIPNYNEFEEHRWFAPASQLRSREVLFGGKMVPIGTDILIDFPNFPHLTLGVEICEDVWMPLKPSTYQALNGATVILNLSASNAVVGKADYRRNMIGQHSADIMAAYIYTSCGVGESTSDVVFDGHALIVENGRILQETERFSQEGGTIYADVDLEYLVRERLVTNTFGSCAAENRKEFRRVACGMWEEHGFDQYFGSESRGDLLRFVDPHPFVPANPATLDLRSEEVFSIQTAGLVQRLRFLDSGGKFNRQVTIGVSGGLDSTLAILVVVQAYDLLGWDRKGITALTMPGFGTSKRTKNNAQLLCQELGVSFEVRSIVKPAKALLVSMGHEPCMNCLMCENAQARIRTNILMTRGFTVGTGDMSEAALGWCTYGGDQLAMYNVNGGVPKTLVSHIVNWTAKKDRFGKKVSDILRDVIDTPISPELLKLGKGGQIVQKTEDKVGPYELNDFFLYHFLRNGFAPRKIFFLATLAFNGVYDKATIKKWLVKFYERLFGNQFKRDANPDGPKVGTVALGQRGDWRMPSDAQVELWRKEAEGISV